MLRRWMPEYLAQRMNPKVVYWRNVSLLVILAYVAFCFIVGVIMYRVRKSITIAVVNTILVTEVAVAFFGIVRMNQILTLGSLGMLWGSNFIFLLFFFLISVTTSDWGLFVIHGVPSIMDYVLLVVLTKATYVFMKQMNYAYRTEEERAQRHMPQARPQPVIIGAGQPAQAQQMEMEEVQKATLAKDGDATCMVCLAHVSNFALVPCGHLVCGPCGTELRRRTNCCHMCRLRIQSMQRIYVPTQDEAVAQRPAGDPALAGTGADP
mmetsp:Transcript_4340/g.6628  ORF Transcript_4340/g.6628 Transcript_4340/m.6628 type:complete len:265 (-) Transcript_4340:177-971(-)